MATTKKTADATQPFDALSAAMNPEAFKEGYERMAEGFSSVADFNKSSMEALMSSTGVYAKGVEAAAQEQTSFLKEAYEDGIAASKAASSASSVQEVLEIQTDYVRSAMEKNLGFATKITDHWVSVAKEASDPISERYGEFVEMVQSYRP